MFEDFFAMLVFSGRMQYIYSMGLASPGSTNAPHPDTAGMASSGPARGKGWSGAPSYGSGTGLTTFTGNFGTPVGGGALGDSVKPGMVVVPDLLKAVPLHIESVSINLLGSDTLTVKGDATGLGGSGTRFRIHQHAPYKYDLTDEVKRNTPCDLGARYLWSSYRRIPWTWSRAGEDPYLAWNRVYLPEIGRWTSADAIDRRHNLLSYVLGNPTNHRDPNGLDTSPLGVPVSDIEMDSAGVRWAQTGRTITRVEYEWKDMKLEQEFISKYKCFYFIEHYYLNEYKMKSHVSREWGELFFGAVMKLNLKRLHRDLRDLEQKDSRALSDWLRGLLSSVNSAAKGDLGEVAIDTLDATIAGIRWSQDQVNNVKEGYREYFEFEGQAWQFIPEDQTGRRRWTIDKVSIGTEIRKDATIHMVHVDLLDEFYKNKPVNLDWETIYGKECSLEPVFKTFRSRGFTLSDAGYWTADFGVQP